MTTLTVKESGPAGAPTIVFLHGLGVSSWMWYYQVNDLQADYHCLCIDLPGNGDSYEQEWISYEDSADKVASIIRASATGGTAHVVGLSLGGYVALHLYANAPELLQTVLLSGIATRPQSCGWLVMKMVACLRGLLRMTCTLTLAAKAMQLPDEAVPLFVRDSQRLDPLTIERAYQEEVFFQYPPNLGNAATTPNGTLPPLLVVAGTREASIVVKSLADLPMKLRSNGGSKNVVRAAKVPNVHHGWNGEAPELFTKMMRLWMTSQELPEELESIVVDVPEEAATASS